MLLVSVNEYCQLLTNLAECQVTAMCHRVKDRHVAIVCVDVLQTKY